MSNERTSKNLKRIILTYPIWDMLLTITNQLLNITLPINQVARFLIMVYFFTMINNSKDIAKCIILSVLMILGEVSNLLAGNSISGDIGYVLKVIFFVITIYAFENILNKKVVERDDLIKYIVLSSFLISGSILISPLGLGLQSWEGGLRSGYKGLFMGQNLITATLLIINPLCMYLILNTKKIVYYICYIMNFFSLILIGTKSGTVGAIVLLVIELLIVIKKTKRSYLKYSIICFLIPLALLLGYIAKGYFIQFINEQKLLYVQMGYTNIISYLISNRDLQIMYLDNYIRSSFTRSPLFTFGLGYTRANSIINLNKTAFQAIEMDFKGLLYYSGIWVLIFIVINIVSRILYSMSNLIKGKFEGIDLFIFISVIVGVVHAFAGGHVIYEALTSMYFAASLAIAKNRYIFIRNEK